MPGDVNKDVVTANKQNVALILAAIKKFKRDATSNEAAEQAAQRKIDGFNATYAAKRKALGQELKAYLGSKHLDPGGCVSDPQDDCLGHIDDIPDDPTREAFKAKLEALNKANDTAVAGPTNDRNDARDRREKAREALLKEVGEAGEQFAATITALTGHTGVSALPVRFNATEVMPDRVYLSTIESGQFVFVANARDYHRGWDLPVVEITSLEELLDDVIRRTQASPIKRLRLLSHGTPTSMRLRMFKNGILELNEDLFETFLDGTLPVFRTLIGRPGVDERVPAAALAAEIANEPGSDLRQTFPLTPVAEIVAAYLVYQALRETKLYRQSAGSHADLVDAALALLQRILRRQLLAEAGVTGSDVTRLRQALTRALTKPSTQAPLASIQFNRLASDDIKGLVDFLGTTATSIEERIIKFHDKLNPDLYLDIRGCEIGTSKRLMRASATLFGIPPSQVTAPKSFVGFAKAERDIGVSLECDRPSMNVVEDLVEDPGSTHSHAPPWHGINYLRSEARFLGILSYPGGWRFASEMRRVKWDDLDPGLKAAETMAYIPFFGWLARAFGSARSVSDLRFFLDYVFDCVKKSLKSPLRDLLRTSWADAPAALVEKLAAEAEAAGPGARPPCIPVLMTSTLASTRTGSGLGLGKLVLSYDPDFSRFIASG